ncbi:hypothetical protein C8J57DRAFT_1525687 [Mycena rebaudengoi]|nr:hypothetical protein C8J57DRAFT_1525687 [Mycena rebaudengoi]
MPFVPVFPGIIIRICQFHVMQAILRWDRDNSAPGTRHPRSALSLARKHQLLYAVHEVQRCRAAEQWPHYLVRFKERLEVIAEGSATTADTLWAYFEVNRFCDEWRDHWTDIGLPAGQNRDRMLSTKNRTERAFKTFKQVFLGNRTNNRTLSPYYTFNKKLCSAYRLVLILANERFQYYQSWHHKKKLDQQYSNMAADAHRLWVSTNAIQPTLRSDGRKAWKVVVLPSRSEDAPQASKRKRT